MRNEHSLTLNRQRGDEIIDREKNQTSTFLPVLNAFLQLWEPFSLSMLQNPNLIQPFLNKIRRKKDNSTNFTAQLLCYI